MLATTAPIMLQRLCAFCSLLDDPMQYQLSVRSQHLLPIHATAVISSPSPQQTIRAPCFRTLPPAYVCRKHGCLSCQRPKYGDTRQTTYMKNMVVQVAHSRSITKFLALNTEGQCSTTMHHEVLSTEH